jgi:uncharacterized protein YkwD
MSRARTAALLALVCAAALGPAGAASAQAPASTCPGADTPAVAGNEAQMDQATLCLLNQQRATAGLAALTENAQLDQTSTAYSRQMVAERFFDHVSPEGVGLVPRLTTIGYLPGNGGWYAGENIAWGQGSLATPQSIMTAWMNSTGHRENILSPNFADVGLGVAIGSPLGDTTGAATYTTDFGRHVVKATTGATTLSTYTNPTPTATVQVTVKPRKTTKAPTVTRKKTPVVTTACTRIATHYHAKHKKTVRACRAARSHPRRDAT